MERRRKEERLSLNHKIKYSGKLSGSELYTKNGNFQENNQNDFASAEAAWIKKKQKLYKDTNNQPLWDFRKIQINPTDVDDLISFSSNKITSNKYGTYSFIFKNIYEQLLRLPNVWFLLISILEYIPAFQSLTNFNHSPKQSTIYLLCFFILVSSLKNMYEDTRRSNIDNQINNRLCYIIDGSNSQLKTVRWMNLKVGNIVRLIENEEVPADIILLSCNNTDGLVYIETSLLNGDTNLIKKFCVNETRNETSIHGVCGIKGRIVCEKPNSNMESFNGSLKLNAHPRATSLSINNVVFKGSYIKNTDYIYGVIIYTGSDTKIMKNTSRMAYKSGFVNKELNVYTIIAIIFTLICVFISVLCKWTEEEKYKNNTSFFIMSAKDNLFISIIKFVLLYANIIPISMLVTVDFISIFQTMLIENDNYISTFEKEASEPSTLDEDGDVANLKMKNTCNFFRKYTLFVHNFQKTRSKSKASIIPTNSNSRSKFSLTYGITKMKPGNEKIVPQNIQHASKEISDIEKEKISTNEVNGPVGLKSAVEGNGTDERDTEVDKYDDRINKKKQMYENADEEVETNNRKYRNTITPCASHFQAMKRNKMKDTEKDNTIVQKKGGATEHFSDFSYLHTHYDEIQKKEKRNDDFYLAESSRKTKYKKDQEKQQRNSPSSSVNNISFLNYGTSKRKRKDTELSSVYRDVHKEHALFSTIFKQIKKKKKDKERKETETKQEYDGYTYFKKIWDRLFSKNKTYECLEENNENSLLNEDDLCWGLCFNSNLHGDLGNVDFIFTDKTGTLTNNDMAFYMCSIGGRTYGDKKKLKKMKYYKTRCDNIKNTLESSIFNNGKTSSTKTSKTVEYADGKMAGEEEATKCVTVYVKEGEPVHGREPKEIRQKKIKHKEGQEKGNIKESKKKNGDKLRTNQKKNGKEDVKETKNNRSESKNPNVEQKQKRRKEERHEHEREHDGKSEQKKKIRDAYKVEKNKNNTEHSNKTDNKKEKEKEKVKKVEKYKTHFEEKEIIITTPQKDKQMNNGEQKQLSDYMYQENKASEQLLQGKDPTVPTTLGKTSDISDKTDIAWNFRNQKYSYRLSNSFDRSFSGLDSSSLSDSSFLSTLSNSFDEYASASYLYSSSDMDNDEYYSIQKEDGVYSVITDKSYMNSFFFSKNDEGRPLNRSTQDYYNTFFFERNYQNYIMQQNFTRPKQFRTNMNQLEVKARCDFSDRTIYDDLNSNSWRGYYIDEFFKCLTLCHAAIPFIQLEYIKNTNSRKLSSNSSRCALQRLEGSNYNTISKMGSGSARYKNTPSENPSLEYEDQIIKNKKKIFSDKTATHGNGYDAHKEQFQENEKQKEGEREQQGGTAELTKIHRASYVQALTDEMKTRYRKRNERFLKLRNRFRKGHFRSSSLASVDYRNERNQNNKLYRLRKYFNLKRSKNVMTKNKSFEQGDKKKFGDRFNGVSFKQISKQGNTKTKKNLYHPQKSKLHCPSNFRSYDNMSFDATSEEGLLRIGGTKALYSSECGSENMRAVRNEDRHPSNNNHNFSTLGESHAYLDAIKYQARSLDEECLVYTSSFLGYRLILRNKNTMCVEIEGSFYKWNIIGINEFTNKRGRMSIVVKPENMSSGSVLYVKGSDASVLSLLNLKYSNFLERKRKNRKKRKAKQQEKQNVDTDAERQEISDKSVNVLKSLRDFKDINDLSMWEESGNSKYFNNKNEKCVWRRPNKMNDIKSEGDMILNDMKMVNSEHSKYEMEELEEDWCTNKSYVESSININATTDSLKEGTFKRGKRDKMKERYKVLEKQVRKFSVQGLRTMICAFKYLNEEETLKYKRMYEDACLSIYNKEQILENVATEIEKDLIFLGITGIRDRLQEKVTKTIEILNQAGIRIWMLTGDNVEYSLHIAFLCKFLTPNTKIFYAVLDENSNNKKLKKEGMALYELFRIAKEEKKPHESLCLLITGKHLQTFLNHTDLQTHFLNMACSSDVVIASRITAKQKAFIVKLIKNRLYPTPNTLAIGDGANDIAMIQEAHIGISIMNKNSIISAGYSDYCIKKFCYLRKLLFIYGSKHLYTISMILYWNFFKNIVTVLPVFFYQAYTSWSCVHIYPKLLYTLFNIFWALLPILYYVFVQHNLNYDILYNIPLFYALSRRKYNMNNFKLLPWIVEAIFYALIVFFFAFFALKENSHLNNGEVLTINTFGTVCFLGSMLISNLRFFLEGSLWSPSIWITVLGLLVFIFSPSFIFVFFVYISDDYLREILRQALLWTPMYVLLILWSTTCIICYILINFTKSIFFPNIYSIVNHWLYEQYQEKDNYKYVLFSTGKKKKMNFKKFGKRVNKKIHCKVKKTGDSEYTVRMSKRQKILSSSYRENSNSNLKGNSNNDVSSAPENVSRKKTINFSTSKLTEFIPYDCELKEIDEGTHGCGDKEIGIIAINKKVVEVQPVHQMENRGTTKRKEKGKKVGGKKKEGEKKEGEKQEGEKKQQVKIQRGEREKEKYYKKDKEEDGAKEGEKKVKDKEAATEKQTDISREKKKDVTKKENKRETPEENTRKEKEKQKKKGKKEKKKSKNEDETEPQGRTMHNSVTERKKGKKEADQIDDSNHIYNTADKEKEKDKENKWSIPKIEHKGELKNETKNETKNERKNEPKNEFNSEVKRTRKNSASKVTYCDYSEEHTGIRSPSRSEFIMYKENEKENEWKKEKKKMELDRLLAATSENNYFKGYGERIRDSRNDSSFVKDIYSSYNYGDYSKNKETDKSSRIDDNLMVEMKNCLNPLKNTFLIDLLPQGKRFRINEEHIFFKNNESMDNIPEALTVNMRNYNIIQNRSKLYDADSLSEFSYTSADSSHNHHAHNNNVNNNNNKAQNAQKEIVKVSHLINRFTLAFKDMQLESGFQIHKKKKFYKTFTPWYRFIFILLGIFFLYTWRLESFLNEKWHITQASSTSLFVMILSTLLEVVLSAATITTFSQSIFIENFNKIISAVIILIITHHVVSYSVTHVDGVFQAVIFPLYTFVILRLPFVNAVLCNIIFLILFIVRFRGDFFLNKIDLVHYIPLFIGVDVFVGFVGYRLEYNQRKNFLLEYAVESSRRKQREILNTMLPPFVVDEMIYSELNEEGIPVSLKAEDRGIVSIIFCDIYEFQNIVASIEPTRLVEVLDRLFLCFDKCTEQFNCTKIETVFETYLAACGLVTNEEQTNIEKSKEDAHDAIDFALSILQVSRHIKYEKAKNMLKKNYSYEFQRSSLKSEDISSKILTQDNCSNNNENEMDNFKTGKDTMKAQMELDRNKEDDYRPKSIRVKIGIHSGRIIAGVVGSKKPQYALFGDTVNTASRMKTTGKPDLIHISEATYNLVKDDKTLIYERKITEVKGKGNMTTYLLTSVIGLNYPFTGESTENNDTAMHEFYKDNEGNTQINRERREMVPPYYTQNMTSSAVGNQNMNLLSGNGKGKGENNDYNYNNNNNNMNLGYRKNDMDHLDGSNFASTNFLRAGAYGSARETKREVGKGIGAATTAETANGTGTGLGTRKGIGNRKEYIGENDINILGNTEGLYNLDLSELDRSSKYDGSCHSMNVNDNLSSSTMNMDSLKYMNTHYYEIIKLRNLKIGTAVGYQLKQKDIFNMSFLNSGIQNEIYSGFNPYSDTVNLGDNMVNPRGSVSDRKGYTGDDLNRNLMHNYCYSDNNDEVGKNSMVPLKYKNENGKTHTHVEMHTSPEERDYNMKLCSMSCFVCYENYCVVNDCTHSEHVRHWNYHKKEKDMEKKLFQDRKNDMSFDENSDGEIEKGKCSKWFSLFKRISKSFQFRSSKRSEQKESEAESEIKVKVEAKAKRAKEEKEEKEKEKEKERDRKKKGDKEKEQGNEKKKEKEKEKENNTVKEYFNNGRSATCDGKKNAVKGAADTGKKSCKNNLKNVISINSEWLFLKFNDKNLEAKYRAHFYSNKSNINTIEQALIIFLVTFVMQTLISSTVSRIFVDNNKSSYVLEINYFAYWSVRSLYTYFVFMLWLLFHYRTRPEVSSLLNIKWMIFFLNLVFISAACFFSISYSWAISETNNLNSHTIWMTNDTVEFFFYLVILHHNTGMLFQTCLLVDLLFIIMSLTFIATSVLPTIITDATIFTIPWYVAFNLISAYCKESIDRRTFYANESAKKTENRATELLNDMLPKHVLEEFQQDKLKLAYTHDRLTFLFADICGFTSWADGVDASEVLTLLQKLFAKFDNDSTKYGLYKLCTIGDAYVAISEPVTEDNHDYDPVDGTEQVLEMAYSMIRIIKEMREKLKIPNLNMRIGLHYGSCVGGVIGSGRLRYDLWGIDVLTGNLMESNGLPGKINVSETLKNFLLQQFKNRFTFKPHTTVRVIYKDVNSFIITDKKEVDATRNPKMGHNKLYALNKKMKRNTMLGTKHFENKKFTTFARSHRLSIEKQWKKESPSHKVHVDIDSDS